MSSFNYSFELYDFSEALTPYGTIETRPPVETTFTIDDFTEGEHFRTAAEDGTNSLILQLEDRLLTLILDESGSMTWNDNNGDRYIYYKRLLTKLDATYPGVIKANLIGFGGILTKTKLFVAQASIDYLTNQEQNFTTISQQTFQDSVYDFAGVRVIRRADHFPTHPADGVVVAEGIFEAVKDENLTQGQTYYYGVWTFNKDLVFSRGQFISAVPYDRILPQGVNFASALPRILPGVERDDNTALIYNFVEGAGYLTFDSSGNGYHGIISSETAEENFWSGDSSSGSYEGGALRKPVGVRFDGEFDMIEVDVGESGTTFDYWNGNKTLIINVWVYHYPATNTQWIIGASTEVPSTEVVWAIGLSEDGQVGVSVSDVAVSMGALGSAGDVPNNTWTMITARIFRISAVATATELYINGALITGVGGGAPSITPERIYVGAKPEDSSSIWFGDDFFGSLAYISIHDGDTAKGVSNPVDIAFIADLYETESSLFNKTISEYSQNPPDNRQREVLLNWQIGSDYDYEGGRVKILRKYRDTPSHDEDGDTVLTRSATPGEFYYMDSYDFVNSSDYYYRIFTYNLSGSVCDRNEARILSVHIPRSINEDASPPLETVQDETITPGSKKLLLQWSNPSDSRWIGTKIYYGGRSYPTVSVSSDGKIEVSDGTEITDTTDEFFVHRTNGFDDAGSGIPLVNGSKHHYTFITYDRLGRISDPVLLLGVPSSQWDTAFPPEEVTDLHSIILNPTALSVKWINPTVRSDRLELYFGETALVFVNVKDIYGGVLEDISDLKLEVCTTIEFRSMETKEQELGAGDEEDEDGWCLLGGGVFFLDEDCVFGKKFGDSCNTEQEERETSLTFSTVQSGLIKGLLTHIIDRTILSRREKYVMDVRAQYKVEDEDVSPPQDLFKFNTESVRVVFKHPVEISLLNLLDREITVGTEQEGGTRGEAACECPSDTGGGGPAPTTYNGGYINATQPYVCRVELQYKGESLPDGIPVNVQLFKHGSESNPNPLAEKSDRTFIREGVYRTSVYLGDQYDENGVPTGFTISKSIVDIEIPHPALSDFVDVYVSLDYAGFFVDAVHEVKFIASLFLTADISQPSADGIDAAEQFATIYVINPDFPDDEDRRLPVADGTLVKWELTKLLFAKERPFYSTEILSELLSGVYSTTTSGVARNIFFGPVGNIQNHYASITCERLRVECCVGEEYAIRASVIYGEESATDAYRFSYSCTDVEEFINRKFLMNAAPDQPIAGGPQSAPHWITWGDGIHMLKFQIAKRPSVSTMFGADCFRSCYVALNGQMLPFPEDHIVQVSAPGEILWDVTFDIDEYTGVYTPITYESVSPQLSEELGIPFVAPIPINGETTDFYVRLNASIGSANPRPIDCETPGSGCGWTNICSGSSGCLSQGIEWVNVATVRGTSTLIYDNKEVTLSGGGNYEEGMPPIYVGFMEPLDVRIIDTRVNGQRVDELVVDGISYHTFTVEVKFAGLAVPDGTPIELRVQGEDENVVILSNCIGSSEGCVPGSSGTVYTRQVNDPLINPSGTKRSLAYFSIDPLPNVAFNAIINVTCHYDRLGTVERNISQCVEVNNTVNISRVINGPPPTTAVIEAATSNESIIYDTIQDLYETTRAGLIRRMGHFAASVLFGTADYIYLFGGYTGSADSTTSNITPLSEFFDTNTQQWSFTTDMPTARAFGMTVVKSTKAYCIGGVELDPLLSQYVVSRKVEVFDAITELWTTLASMPEDYGVAYGDAQIIGDYIYIVCGITELSDSSKPQTLNDKVLRYSITDDSWEKITPSSQTLYGRITPFAFYRSTPRTGSEADKKYYIYGGSIPKPLDVIEAERAAKINELLEELYSFVRESAYFHNLSLEEQESYLLEKKQEINDGVIIPAYIYPSTGFRFTPGDEVGETGQMTLDISDTLDSVWPVLPKQRNHGQTIYIPHQDIAYFMGGANQNQSTTINRVESIDLFNNHQYAKLTSFNRGRAMFAAVAVADDIYFSGGLTSGHRAGYISINIEQNPELVKATGTQSCGFLITLKNDSGEIVDEDIRVDIRGRLRMPAIDNVLADFIAHRGADRALGGDGSGNAADLPESGDQFDVGKFIKAQNKIIDPNSDEFQFNAARKLNEQVFLFPILYSRNKFIILSGMGGVTLLPRSEDPLADFQKLSEFIQTVMDETPTDPNERFQGDLTREELAALGDVLNTVQLPPTIIDAGALRDLYEVETIATILDDYYYGQTVSDFDLNIQERIESRIIELLTPPDDNGGDEGLGGPGGVGLGGSPVEDSECFVIQHIAQPDVPGPSTPPSTPTPGNPAGTGGYSQSGQCLFCQTLLPLNVKTREQLPTMLTKFYNNIDWMPQIKKRLVSGTSTVSEVLAELEIIDHEVPFGGSQLYNAIFEAARVTAGEHLNDLKKVIYIASDNSQNLSLVTRDNAIEEVNAIDGDAKVPVIYPVFSTSFPLSLAAQLQRTEIGDIEKITKATGGQSTTLIASGFLDQILNLTLGAATGGLGYGIYTRKLELDELSALTSMVLNFSLPSNTQGFVRFRYSQDGFNFSDFSERFEGSQTADFSDFFANVIEVEVVLTTGFTTDIEEEYDTTATDMPKLVSIVWYISGEREDFLFLNKEDVLTNVQQAALTFEGTVPTNAIIDIGLATSNSHDWRDFQTAARPAIREFGKTFLLERTDDPFSLVPIEPMVSINGLQYSSVYGPWDPEAVVDVYEVSSDGDDIPVLTGYVLYPREGEIYFDTKNSPSKTFKLSITNNNVARVGLRLENRLHEDAISIQGVGYIYSTNDDKPLELSQVAPRVINVHISPQSPNAGDTFFALYDYIDLNNDPETGSILSWYKNGKQLLEIQNKTSWSNSDLLSSNKLEPDDKIFFSIMPSDGRDYGSTVFSPAVSVVPQKPGATDLRVIPFRNGIVNDRYDTSSTLTIEYEFSTEDTGEGSLENGTIIKWYVDGQLFKEGTFSAIGQDPYTDPKSLVAGESSDGVLAHTIGNQIQVEVTPKTSTITGETITSSIITIVNSVPIANTVQITPVEPTVGSTLVLSYTIDDLDIDGGIQTDQSEIKWYSSSDGVVFSEITALGGQLSATPFYIRIGEQWYAQVTAYDGLDLGITVSSNTVTIAAG